jgi:putative CocE/NonD family hydrolase
VDREPPVRVFVMGDNRWRTADRWPIPGARPRTLYLYGAPAAPSDAAAGPAPVGVLDTLPTPAEPRGGRASSFVSDPADPMTDPYADSAAGPHDYTVLAGRRDQLLFETAPLAEDLEVVGAMTADVYLSTDAPDTDLWVKVLDVAPDGTALNLMSPGLDVLRASYAVGDGRRTLLRPGHVYRLTFPDLLTANTFKRGHRIRVMLSAAFAPHFSRNLHTGKLELTDARMRRARITVHHDRAHPSRLTLPVMPRGPHESLP